MPLEYNRCLVCPVRGLCCYFSTMIDGENVILEDHPCDYLNINTGLCTRFKDRKEVFKNCLSIEDAKKIGGLPEGCLYLKKGEKLNYPPKRKLRPDDNERLKTRYEYVNSMTHKNFQVEKSNEIIELLSDKLMKEEKST